MYHISHICIYIYITCIYIYIIYIYIDQVYATEVTWNPQAAAGRHPFCAHLISSWPTGKMAGEPLVADEPSPNMATMHWSFLLVE